MQRKELSKIWNEAKNEDFISSHSLNKYHFQSLLSGMIAKLLGNKNEQAIKQLAILNRMDNFMDRLSHVNCIQILQAKIIKSQDMRIVILEQEKEDLIDELSKIKKITKW